MPIEALKVRQSKMADSRKKSTKNNNEINNTLKGVLMNNHVRGSQETTLFNDMKDSLLICDSKQYYSPKEKEIKKDEKESSFNVGKAIKPLLIGTGVVLAGSLGLTAILAKASKTKMSAKPFEQLPDLAINMNIKEEPQFAIYRAIRDPNFSNILGAAGIFLMSGITIASKNFVDGAKEIWLKKQSADIEKELQENLIEVETNSFSGKLKVVNDLMDKNVKYFDSVLNKTKETNTEATPNIFSKFVSFKGDKTQNEDEKNQKTNIISKIKDNKNLKYAALIGGVIAAAAVACKFSISNLRKTAEYANSYANNFTEKTINAINTMAEKSDKKDLPAITELLQSICAKPNFIQEIGRKYHLSAEEIQGLASKVEEGTKTKFADAPTALGGIPKKIQYYCYIDENRGHLYNWILNPDNKFTKYIFLAFTSSSAIGYLFKQGMDAVKEATVMKENAKTELDLRKRLVDVEIANFKAKKESAINPLIENFAKQAQEGNKTPEELKQVADNILMETKNGPPYVYS